MNRQLLFESAAKEPSRVVDFAESYADSVHPSGRLASRRAFIDGYLQAMEHEGMYADDCQRRLSSAYSSLKDAHVTMKMELRHQVRTGPKDKDQRRELYLLLKQEFDGKL